MKKWMVYFINSEGYRDGCEYVHASNKKEALTFYHRFFNVPKHDNCVAIPTYGPDTYEYR